MGRNLIHKFPSVLPTKKERTEQMQYKETKKIMIDQRKLETLFRIGCPDNLIIELLKTRTFTPTGDSLIDDNLESLLDYKYFVNNGWGGKRNGAGRKSQKTSKNNHLENQVDNQVDNQDANQDIIKSVDKDIDIDNKESIGGVGEKRETIDENTPFKAGGQMWTMPLQFRKLAKKYWAESEIREIEIEHSCHEEPVELTINDLLTIKPPKPKKKSYGEQQKVKLTDEEYTKLKELYGDYMDSAIDTLDRYLATNNKKYASHYAVMRKGNWVYTQIMKNKLNDERGF